MSLKKHIEMNANDGNVRKMRSSEVVVRSMLSSQMACILTAVGPQLVIILNALIVSRFLEEECFKAISAFNPISGLLFILINTCCIGPSIHAGKAYGELNVKKANRLFSFSASVAVAIGIISASVFFASKSIVARKMTSDICLQGYLVDYIGPVSLYLMLSAFTCLLNTFVTASGHIKKVTAAVLASGMTNVAAVLILIKVFHCGVEAAGIAMCISALVNIIFLLPVALGKQFPFRLVKPDSGLTGLVKDNFATWISINSGSLSDGLFVFLINFVILRFLPYEGLFIWGVCQIAITVFVCIYCGISEAYLYIDAFLMGEGDNAGRLKIAKGFLCEAVIVMSLMAVVFTVCAERIAGFLGSGASILPETVKFPLICAVWFISLKEILITFGIVSVQRKPMIKLGYDILATVATPAMVFLSALLLGSANLWLGFAVTPLLLASYVAIVNVICCRKDRNLIPFFLFNKINDVVTLDVSIAYCKGNIHEELSRIRTFLNICEIGGGLAAKIELCCEELMFNIQGMHSKGSSFDLRLSDCEDCVNLAVKNVGRPISPVINNGIVNDFIENGTIPNCKDLSMFYILHCGDKVEYRYVYGMNVAFLSFMKPL